MNSKHTGTCMSILPTHKNLGLHIHRVYTCTCLNAKNFQMQIKYVQEHVFKTHHNLIVGQYINLSLLKLSKSGTKPNVLVLD